ncbi:YopJ family acetyltransferase [Ralstonia sp. GX3-BWBA]|uniref:YopJ family acetyltransferase n=1 Tax=Ralstonia sp. GX3-BWBA TaxID=2219865 RepID=UPI000DD4DD3F|nr:YopJ family acetyltransferase [Ralstonia sp. GX3-BWBA]
MKVNHTSASHSAAVPTSSAPSTSGAPAIGALDRRRRAPADAPDMPPPRRQRLNTATASGKPEFRRVQLASVTAPARNAAGTSAATDATEPLLDNRPTLEKMGIEHPLLGHSWYGDPPDTARAAGKQPVVHERGTGQTSQTASGPQLTPSQEAAIEHARSQVRSTLQGPLTKLQQALDRNLDLEIVKFPIKKVDWALAPLLMAAENARNPGLNLVALHMDTAEAGFDDDEDDLPPLVNSHNFGAFIESAPPGRYGAIVNDGPHTRAADIRKDAQGTTVIVVDPLRKEEDEAEYDQYADNVSSEAGEHAKCAFIPVDLQKSAFGCRIFSMSLALKMHAREGDFSALHDALRSGTDPTPLVSRAKTTEELGALLVLDGAPLIDARMMKHSHAGSSVERYVASHPDQSMTPVNKRNETLQSRTSRHLTEREVLARVDPNATMPVAPTKTARLSTSIEHKRISMIGRAIAYLDGAPPQAVANMAHLVSRASRELAKQ